MKIVLTLFMMLALLTGSLAQEPVGKIIKDLTFQWDNEALSLADYQGLQQFCRDAEYRNSIVKLLKDMHHYDSVLYKRLSKAARFGNADKEVKKTLSDIEEFESEYDVRNFLVFLKDECNSARDLERNRDDLEDEIGENSYDEQRYILELELQKFIKSTTKRADLIVKHVEHLHLE